MVGVRQNFSSRDSLVGWVPLEPPIPACWAVYIVQQECLSHFSGIAVWADSFAAP